MRRSCIVLYAIVLACLSSLATGCRDRGEQVPEPTVAPGYVATSVVESLSAAATYRSSREESTATHTPIPSPPPTVMPATSTPTTAPTATPTPDPQPASAMVIADGLRVRNGPGVGYAVSGMVHEGTEVLVVARTTVGDWLQIASDSGLAGWVFAEYVELSVNLESVPVASELPPTLQPTESAGGG